MSIDNVPRYPGAPNKANMTIGKPVCSADQWLPMAEASNYLNSHEMTLVAAISDPYPIATSRIYFFRIRPRLQARRYLWVFTFATWDSNEDHVDTPIQCNGALSINGGTATAFSISGEPIKYLFVLQDETQTSTPVVRYVAIGKTGGDQSLVVNQIACYQLRRYGLNPNRSPSEDAADNASVLPGAIIKDKTCFGIDGPPEGIADAKTKCRRGAMFNWSSSDTSGVLIGQATWQNLFAAQPEVLARYLEDGVTTRTVQISYIAALGTDGATISYLRAIADSGDSATVAVTGSNTYNTYIQVNTEDLSDNLGRQSSVTDRITFAVYGNGNVVESEDFAVRLYSINVGEAL